ncbi:hypothetical protein HCH_03219 [Hahella chejuensis KCTC 2396]|uniref:Uncharacterized protein n=1 Tax=Hahella chejuensis (strain KCTC 2396) TaxID=349521 RepID=Q2SH94_HAHCH|nr:DUF6348 family protein [Hahella chejuensis]ABC29980.1 hypothetical protein HCH_03219 [Hahella chejuensis KCTC 2396]
MVKILGPIFVKRKPGTMPNKGKHNHPMQIATLGWTSLMIASGKSHYMVNNWPYFSPMGGENGAQYLKFATLLAMPWFPGLSSAEHFLKIVFLAIFCRFNKTSSKKRSAIPLRTLWIYCLLFNHVVRFAWGKRGELVEKYHLDKLEQLISVQLSKLQLSNETHWVKLVVSNVSGKIETVALTVDGMQSDEVNKEVSSYSWPASKQFYMVILFFVVGKA